MSSQKQRTVLDKMKNTAHPFVDAFRNRNKTKKKEVLRVVSQDEDRCLYFLQHRYFYSSTSIDPHVKTSNVGPFVLLPHNFSTRPYSCRSGCSPLSSGLSSSWEPSGRRSTLGPSWWGGWCWLSRFSEIWEMSPWESRCWRPATPPPCQCVSSKCSVLLIILNWMITSVLLVLRFGSVVLCHVV